MPVDTLISTEAVECGRIDSHHHLWRYAPKQFPWMTEELAVLRRDFLVPDLVSVARESQISGTIVVQARHSIDETRGLLELAAGSQLVRGVVGWAPLANADVLPTLELLASHPRMKGVRHILHDEMDEAYMLGKDFNRGVSYLKDLNLVYDLLIFERHLPSAIEFVDRHPQQVFVLDHIGKPQIGNKSMEPWKSDIRKLAQRDNVYCKVSGMVTEADWKKWCADDLRPYFEIVLEAFGPGRLMFASDWPVVTLAAPYRSWVSFVESATARLSSDEKMRIWHGTATHVYRLNQESG